MTCVDKNNTRARSFNVVHPCNKNSFSEDNSNIYGTFMVPRPRPKNEFWMLSINTTVFDNIVWKLFVAVTILVIIILWKSIQFHGNGYSGIIEVLLAMYGMFLGTGSFGRIRSSYRYFVYLVIGSWSIFCFLVVSIFSNTSLSSLLVPEMTPLVDSIEDIVRGNYLWCQPGGDPANIKDYAWHVFNIENEWQRRLILHQFRDISENKSREALHSGRYVYTVKRLGQEYTFAEIKGTEGEDFHEHRVIRGHFYQVYLAFTISQRSPLVSASKPILQRFVETGLIEHWKKDVVLKHGDVNRMILLENTQVDDGMDNVNALTIQNNLVAMEILIAGLLLSLLVFIFELVFNYWYDRYRRSKDCQVYPFIN